MKPFLPQVSPSGAGSMDLQDGGAIADTRFPKAQRLRRVKSLDAAIVAIALNVQAVESL